MKGLPAIDTARQKGEQRCGASSALRAGRADVRLYGILYRGDMGARTIAVCFTREAAAVELSLCGRDGERDHASTSITKEAGRTVYCVDARGGLEEDAAKYCFLNYTTNRHNHRAAFACYTLSKAPHRDLTEEKRRTEHERTPLPDQLKPAQRMSSNDTRAAPTHTHG